MEVILAIAITILFCALCLFMYLAHMNNIKVLKLKEEIRLLYEENNIFRNKLRQALPSGNNTEILRLENSLHEKDQEILRLNNALSEKENEINNFSYRQVKQNEEIWKLKENLCEKENELLRLKNSSVGRDENSYKVVYLEAELSRKKDEIAKLKETLREENRVILQLKETLREKEEEIVKLKTPTKPSTKPSTNGKKFVSVIFKKGDKKRYDYFLRDSDNIKVGDFVEVYADDTYAGKSKWNVVKVVYVSSPGETSKHAKSTIIKKADYNKW